jgi:hypothetical protein
MATAAEIQAQIAHAQRLLEQRREEKRLSIEESNAADERQRLRRELDQLNALIETEEDAIGAEQGYREAVDNDEEGVGAHQQDRNGTPPLRSIIGQNFDSAHSSLRQSSNCSDAVVSGEMEWEIVGMSWLRSTLTQNREAWAECDIFHIGGETFDLLFDPDRCVTHGRGEQEDERRQWKGSLVVRHYSRNPITFRHTFFVKRSDGEFVQWGATGEESHTSDTQGWCFGPDCVRHREPHSPAAGIFGLGHDALLRSEWVVGDALTVKVRLVGLGWVGLCWVGLGWFGLRHTLPGESIK